MSKRTITSFFSPAATEKRAKAAKGAVTSAGDNAKSGAQVEATTGPEPMSPAARAEANRRAALAKLAAAKSSQASPGSNSSRSSSSSSRSGATPEASARTGEGYLPPVPESWRGALEKETSKAYFKHLDEFVAGEAAKGKKVYPPREDIFSALNMCPFDKVRVVVIGQDPYHGAGQGHGLAFSVRRGVKTPPSLRNMLKEAASCEGIRFPPSHGNLEAWARQGVLLLNTVLTVEAGKADSHKGRGWETFTDAVVSALNRREGKGLVFLLWGKPAAKKGCCVNRARHCVITTSHPSPLGATKTATPFIGSKCFSVANAYLEEQGEAKIDWNLD